ncbi:MAG: serine--tRNA ligase [Deltaproteobacteria bacterium RBG_16_71_12]|nr:MAG: serine--tRNA ligase [Deltaproteobacteria bacterium RBG_16_71_12]
MIDHKALEQDPDAFARALRRRGDIANLDELLRLSRERKELIGRLQALQEERNRLNEGMKKATPAEREAGRDRMRKLGDDVKALEGEQRIVEERRDALALHVPNPPRADVPDGNDEHGNVEVRRVLEPKKLDFTPRDHVDLGVGLELVDIERAAKISGARFAFLKGQGARLERALASFMLDFHLAAGDVELAPPLLVTGQTLVGTGQLPKFGEDLFSVNFGPPKEAGAAPLYLIPTSEVPITNYYAGEILDEERLPLRFCAFSQCFRAEAGSAGRDTRGLIRQHQFEKVEMVRFATPEQANDELELMVQRASDLLTALELPHRVVALCTGDMGFAAEKTFDLEVWLPSQATYREISSCSSCGSFQARRAQIRYRPTPADQKKPEKPRPLATLNGSGLAVGRTWVALLENHQHADGSVRIPERLRPYLGGVDTLRKDERTPAP